MLIKIVLNFLLLIVVCNNVNGNCTIPCKYDEFCSPLHNLCFKCAETCKIGHELKNDCPSACAAYLAEQNRTKQSLEVRELKEKVNSLQSLVKVSFILSGVGILITCILILFLTYKWCQRKGLSLSTLFIKHEKQKASQNNREPETNLSDVKVQTISRNDDLQIKMSDNSLSETAVDSPTTVTTSISRRGAPSESRGFDYTYDNPAMSTQGTQGSRDTGF